MTNAKTTRRALLTSVMSLILCCSMLLGTTFAWFTDTVTSAKNTIMAGNLDIELEYKKVVNGVATDWASVQDQSNIFDSQALWEPGRVEVVYLRVSNLGSLALKYQLGVNVVSETTGINVEGDEFKLSDHLVFTVVEMPNALTTYSDRDAVAIAAGTELGLKDYNGKTTPLDAKDGANDEDYVALIVYMPETVGNEANYRGTQVPKIELGINLYATQLNAEEDSFGKDYDEEATHEKFKVTTANDLQTALNNAQPGDTIEVANDIVADESIVIPPAPTTLAMRSTPAPVVIKLNGNTISANFTKNDGALIINNGNLVIIGNEDSVVENKAVNGSSVILNNGILEITGGKYIGAPSDTTTGTASYAINTDGATAELTLNNVNVEGRGVIGATNGAKVVINGGTYHTPAVAWGHAVYAVDEGTKVVINDGTFSEGYEYSANNWGMYQIYSGIKANVTVYGGTFMPWDCANGYDLCTATEGVIEIYGGTFAEDPSKQNNINYVVDGYKTVENNGKYIVVANTISNENVVGTPNELASALGNAADAGSGNNTLVLSGDIDLTGTTWTPISVDGYHGAGVITVEGNGATIKGLTAPLFAGGFAGKSGIVIKNLTIADSNIAGGNQGGGAFIDCADSMHVITLDNCHLINSTVTGERAGGLIGWCSGYAKLDDGPVKANVTITNCSVIDSTVHANGSAGAIAGHPGASDYTYTTIEDCVVKNVKVISDEPVSSWRTGAIVGTANNGHVVINNVTVENVTLTQDGVTATETKLYGRFVPSGTGTLVIDGAQVVETADYLRNIANSATGDIVLTLGADITLGNETEVCDAVNFANADSVTIDGNNNSIIFKGKAGNKTDTSIERVAGILSAGKITVKNVTLVNDKLSYAGTETSADRIQVYTTIRGASVAYENVTFDGGVQVKGDETFKDCTFTENVLTTDENGYAKDGRFCMFIDHEYGTETHVITLEGCTFNASGYGCVKVAGDNGAEITVNVKDCSFTNTCPSNSWSQATPKYDVKMTGDNVTVNNLGGNTWSSGANAGFGKG